MKITKLLLALFLLLALLLASCAAEEKGSSTENTASSASATQPSEENATSGGEDASENSSEQPSGMPSEQPSGTLLEQPSDTLNEETASFDFMKEVLSQYINLPAEKFIGQTVKIDIPDEIDAVAIDAYVRTFYSTYGLSVYSEDKTVAEGDIVSLYYRVTETVDGEEKEISSNFNGDAVDYDPNNNTLKLGDDFNAALVGIDKDHKVTTATSGKVTEEHNVLYVTYSYVYLKPGTTGTYVGVTRAEVERWDLDELKASAKYGEDFVSALVGKTVGFDNTVRGARFDANGDGEPEDVTMYVTILRANTEKPVSFKVTYPDDHENTALKGKEVTFYVCINGVAGTFDEIVTEKTLEELGYTPDEDSEFKDEPVKAFRAWVQEYLEEDRHKTIRANALEALWDSFYEDVEIIKYPEVLVNDYYNALVDEAEYYWEQYQASSSKDPSIKTLNDFVVSQYALEKGTQYETYFRDQAEDAAKYDLVYYTIVRHGGLSVSDAEYEVQREGYIATMIYNYQLSYYQTYGQVPEMTEASLISVYGADYVEASVRQSILNEKFSEYLYENVTVEQKTETDTKAETETVK